MVHKSLKLVSVLMLFSIVVSMFLTACGPANDVLIEDQDAETETGGGEGVLPEKEEDSTVEPVGLWDSFPLFPGSESIQSGEYSEIDEYVDQMEGLPLDTTDLAVFILPAEATWEAVRDFYLEQIAANNWLESPEYAWEEADRGAVVWQTEDSMVMATFDPDGPEVPFLVIQISALGEQANQPGELEATETGASSQGGDEPVGAADADSGFRPATDGFSFENYGDDIQVINLTPTEMQRMFGDQVCASMAGGECILTPPAEEWMNNANVSMAGGHCEGMAVLSTLFYYAQSNPDDFGSTTTSDLSLDNENLQREIAYWFITQSTYPGSTHIVNESPEAVVNTLTEVFAQGKNTDEWWVLGIYQPDFSGGHAITPIAVDDLGDGKYQIQVYDNNFPGEVRMVDVDTVANTWSYMASTNPNEPEALYEGDATTQTLEVVAISPRLGVQECQFCTGGSAGNRTPGLGATNQQYYEIWLEGKADLLIIDENGQRIGNVDGQFVNEIPGAGRNPIKLGVDVWGQDYEPTYRVPVGRAFEIIIDAGKVNEPITASVSMIGPGYFLSVDDIWLEPETQDSINVYVDGSRHQLTYMTDYSDSPVVMMGIETDGADYAFIVQATELVGAYDTFDVAVDLATGEFILNTDFNEEASLYDFYVLRIDDEGLSAFGTTDFEMQPDTTIYLQYAAWNENGAIMLAELDYGNDGEIDEIIELPDTSDEFIWE